jgi:hypothetical protein
MIADHVVAEESVDGDVAAKGKEGIGGIEIPGEVEAFSDGVFDSGVKVEFGVENAARFFLAEEATAKGFEVELDGFFE